MDLSRYIAELRDSLAAAAALGDENSQRSASALAGALEPAARLALLHALSDLATEVTDRLAETAPPGEATTVDVRLDGRDVRVVVSRTTADSVGHADTTAHSGGPGADQAAADDHARSFAEASGDLTRTTVRMFNQLKAQAEKAAAQQGVSLNSFISRAVADSVRDKKAWKQARSEWRSDARDGRSTAPTDSPSTISGYVQG